MSGLTERERERLFIWRCPKCGETFDSLCLVTAKVPLSFYAAPLCSASGQPMQAVELVPRQEYEALVKAATELYTAYVDGADVDDLFCDLGKALSDQQDGAE